MSMNLPQIRLDLWVICVLCNTLFRVADAAARSVAAWLGPFDQGLLRLYTVVAVVAGARVLIKWKTIALEFILHQRAGLTDSLPVTLPGAAKKAKRKGSVNLRSSGSATNQAAAAAAWVAQLAAPAPSAQAAGDAEDDFDEAACVQREGSMLCVSMRPRSTAPAAAAAAAVAAAEAAGNRVSDAGGSVSTAAAVGTSSGSAAAVGGWGGSSKADVAWPAQGAREDDAVERLLLPLDRCAFAQPRPCPIFVRQHHQQDAVHALLSPLHLCKPQSADTPGLLCVLAAVVAFQAGLTQPTHMFCVSGVAAVLHGALQYPELGHCSHGWPGCSPNSGDQHPATAGCWRCQLSHYWPGNTDATDQCSDGRQHLPVEAFCAWGQHHCAGGRCYSGQWGG